ncbi:MAG: radical SAM protein [Phycisphaerae bacterium]|nr:radical SAM protein [Phycisphaerae bacterium]
MPVCTPNSLRGTAGVRSKPRHDPRLDAIQGKVIRGERLTLEDGDRLYTTPDIWGLCELADMVRKRLHGDAAFYNINRHFNYSNVCALSCKFCEFYRKAGDEGAYTRNLEQARDEGRKAVASGATEMHIVGGLHPTLPFEYYTDLLRAIREAAPSLHLKAFTAVEIVHLAKIAKVFKQTDRASGIRWVLEKLKEAGLGSLPGGGAEVFDDRVHDEAFKGKIRSDVWLDVHRVAHELGLNTNATILYGHIEDRADRLVHMDMLRRAQDEALRRLGYLPDETGAVTLTRRGVALPTPSDRGPGTPPGANAGGYFQTIIPLPFFPDGSELERLPGPGGIENLRTLAVARLMLDNFPHVKAFWIMQTLSMAQLMLQSGADDIDGTVVWYDITKIGGSSTHQETTVWDLQRAIREAGFRPVERDTLYRRVVRDGREWRVEA